MSRAPNSKEGIAASAAVPPKPPMSGTEPPRRSSVMKAVRGIPSSASAEVEARSTTIETSRRMIASSRFEGQDCASLEREDPPRFVRGQLYLHQAHPRLLALGDHFARAGDYLPGVSHRFEARVEFTDRAH